MTVQMEIVCVGNELLIGKITNTNASWMAKKATTTGILVKRITVVADSVKEIAAVIIEALKRKPRFLVATGGLGPTFDDMTLRGIARALNRPLRVNERALQMVREKYDSFVKEGKAETIEMTSQRVKMATFPEGAEPLPNPAGTAPGIITEVEGTILIALPGVPSEMKAIFEEPIIPLLKKEAGENTFFETSIFADAIMESTLAPLIDQVMHNVPCIYVKSHPKGKESTPHIELHISTIAENSKTADDRLGKAIVQLTELIQRNHGKVIGQNEVH